MPNRVVHFEIPAKDLKRVTEFYEKAFGWKMVKQNEEYGGYIVAQTGDPMPDPKDWGINGGLFQTDKNDENLKAFRCVIGVEDIEKSIESVRKAGGKINHIIDPSGKDLGEKSEIPGVGIWAKCEDTEGNQFSLLQPFPGEWMPKEN